MKSDLRRGLFISLLLATLAVLVLAYVPILRVHQGWQDEVYWFSTCLSIVRHAPAIPSVLADFPGSQSPLRFYGPSLFWLGALALKLFGVTIESWRSYTFAGGVVFLAAIAILFHRLRGSWLLAAAAAFLFSLSISSSFGFSLPGRPDAWGVAVLVLAMAVGAPAKEATSDAAMRPYARWLFFGALLGVAATTSPRTWPLISSFFVTLPLLIDKQKLTRMILACASALATITIILLPLHLSPWGFLVYVRAASSHDSLDISPLMGGSWGFGHALSQTVYYGAILVILAVLQASRWRELDRFSRWLLAAGVLNLLLALLLLSRALNMPTYWGFPLEVSALLALTMPVRHRFELAARYAAVLLLVFMLALRIARETPVFAHWQERDPARTERPLAAAIPAGSLVYGPIGEYFFPILSAGSEDRYLRDWTTPGRSSVAGVVNTPAPMIDACSRAAYLVWPAGTGSEPLPALEHASMTPVAAYRAAPERIGGFERMVERVPGGRTEREESSFSVYRLHMDPIYCRSVLSKSGLAGPAS